MTGNIKTNGELEQAVKRYPATIGRALYEDMAHQADEAKKEIANLKATLLRYDRLTKEVYAVHQVLDAFGVPTKFDTLAGRVDAALRLAEMRGATWQPDLDELDDYLVTVDASSHRGQ